MTAAFVAARDAESVELSDRTWGEGNWVRCADCPDSFGHPSRHHRDNHPPRTSVRWGDG